MGNGAVARRNTRFKIMGLAHCLRTDKRLSSAPTQCFNWFLPQRVRCPCIRRPTLPLSLLALRARLPRRQYLKQAPESHTHQNATVLLFAWAAEFGGKGAVKGEPGTV